MSDFINKIVLIILTFVLLVLAPLTVSYMISEQTTERLVLNEVTQFIDKVTDKGSIVQSDLDDIYLGVNSTGGTYDVNVQRFIRVASQNADGTPRTVYFSNGDLSTLNKGDVVKVTIDEIGVSPAKRLIWALLKIDSGKFNFSLAGAVR